MSLLFTDGGSTRVELPAGLDDLSAFTVLQWLYPTASTDIRRLWNKGAGNMKNIFSGYTFTDDLAMYVIRATTAGAVETAANAFTLNAWNYVCGTYSEANGPRLWRGIVGAGATSADSSDPWTICNDNGDATGFPGGCSFWALFSREMDRGDLLRLQEVSLRRRPFTVDSWTPEITVSLELLEEPMNPGLLVRDGDILRFSVANGSATYRIVEHIPQRREVRAVLETCRLDVAP